MIAVIRIDGALDRYEAELLSESFAKQIERGVVVLDEGKDIEFMDENSCELECIEEPQQIFITNNFFNDEEESPEDEEESKMDRNTVTQKDIDKLLKDAKVEVKTVFDKCTVVTVQLANGFVITESSACVDPVNYDGEVGKKICMKRIENKLWELEGYYLQKCLHNMWWE